MVGQRWRTAEPWTFIQKPLAFGLALQMLWGSAIAAPLPEQLSETAPPKTFTTLRRVLDQYQPQIKILSPKAGELLTDNSVNVTFEIKDLPIYKDKTLQLGPHLHLQIDDRPYQSIYNPTETVLLKDLEPGTHTLRLFAASPWDESFKNDGAFAQVTFHIFTKTDDNTPKPNQPLLTYNQPQGNYGAEPILLDFYLTNAPLHLIAQENDNDTIQDWKIKATINGQSFLLDRWQPTYLQGFKPGKNWVQLEFIDQNGNRVENFGNNTARIFTYEPNGQNPIAQLTRGELTIAQSKGIVDPTYTPPAPPKPIETAPAEPKVDLKSEVKSGAKPEIKPAPAEEPVKPLAKPPSGIVPIIPLAKPPSGIVPIPLPQKAPDLKTPIEAKPAASKPEVKPEAKPEKAPDAQPRTRKIIQKLLPAFMGPGKKIDVKTPLAKPPGTGIVTPTPAAPATIAPVKPATQPTATKPVNAKPVDKKPTVTKPIEAKSIEAKPIEAKPVEKKSDEPKKGNWFDRFRKPEKDEKTTAETKPNVKSDIKLETKPETKPDVKPTKTPTKSNLDSAPISIPNDLSGPSKGISIPAIPLPLFLQKVKAPAPQIAVPKSDSADKKLVEKKTAESKPVESKPLDNNVRKKPAIEARKPFKFNFGSNKKPETKLTPTPEPTPTPTAQPTPQITPKPTTPTTPTTKDQTKSNNWFEQFRKPSAEKAESKPVEIKPTEIKPTEIKPTEIKPTEIKPTEIKPTEIKPLAKPPETRIVKPTATKALQPKQPQKEVIKKDTEKVPVTIPSRSESSNPLQITPGKKVDVKTPIKSQPKPEVKPQPKPEVKTPIKPQPKPEIKAQSKPEVKPQPKSEIKPQPKPEIKQNLKPEPKPEVKPQIKPEPKISVQQVIKDVTKPTPIKSTPITPKPTITPKSTPQNTIKPISKPIEPKPIAKPNSSTTKPDEKLDKKPDETPNPKPSASNQYDYLKEYLNKPTPQPSTPTVTK